MPVGSIPSQPIRLRGRERIAGVEVVLASVADELADALLRVILRHREWAFINDAYRAIPKDDESKKAERDALGWKRNTARGKYKDARLKAYALLHAHGVLHPSIEAL